MSFYRGMILKLHFHNCDYHFVEIRKSISILKTQRTICYKKITTARIRCVFLKQMFSLTMFLAFKVLFSQLFHHSLFTFSAGSITVLIPLVLRLLPHFTIQQWPSGIAYMLYNGLYFVNYPEVSEKLNWHRKSSKSY